MWNFLATNLNRFIHMALIYRLNLLFYNSIQKMYLYNWTLLLSLCYIGIKPMELGQNLIVNGRFRQPDIMAANVSLKIYTAPNFLPGWKCSLKCEIDNCRTQVPTFLGSKRLFGNCSQQVLDLSSTKIQTVTQVFVARQGAHFLEIEFLIPFYFANKKTMLVYLNGENIYRFTPLVSQQFYSLHFQTQVYTIVGDNNLTFTMEGLSDFYGFRLVSVSLRKIIDNEIENIIQGIFTNGLTVNVVAVPGSRVFFGQLLNAFVSLDRMQLYYYHNRNYSHYATLFLRGVCTLMNSKGELSLKIQKKALGDAGQRQQEFISQLDYKHEYINTFALAKSQNGFGFLANNANLFVYSLPFFVLSLSLLYAAFCYTFNAKFSKLLRKYSFFGIIVLQILFEGNVEQFTFYLCGELTTFFSADVRHKAVNTFIAFFLFALCFYAVAAYFWCWKCYRRRIKYFTDNAEYSFEGILAYTLSSGVMCMVLGAVHQLLLPSPDLQIFVLMGVETAWIVMQLLMISRKAYEVKLVIYLSIFEGVLRIGFQLSLFLFDKGVESCFDASFLNSVNLRQIFLFIAVWGIQFAVSLLIFLKGYVDMARKNKAKIPQTKIKRVKVKILKVRFHSRFLASFPRTGFAK